MKVLAGSGHKKIKKQYFVHSHQTPGKRLINSGMITAWVLHIPGNLDNLVVCQSENDHQSILKRISPNT